MNRIYKIGISGALLLGMFSGIQAEGKLRSKLKFNRQWVKDNSVLNDRSKTTNDDGSVTRTSDRTLTTKKGNEVDLNIERTSTKNEDGTRSFTSTRTATNDEGKTRVVNSEGTVSRNGNGTLTVNRASTINRANGTSQTREGSKVVKSPKAKGKKK